MAKKKNNNMDIWRVAAVGMATSVVTLGGFFFMVGRNAVTRSEVLEIVRTQAPYIEDRQLLQETIVKNSASIDEIQLSISAIQIEQARIETKLDDIIGLLERDRIDALRVQSNQ